MPYELVEDLPNTVRSHLAERAQDIYLAAFNSAWTNYAGLDVDQLEEIGHRVAWAEVRKRIELTAQARPRLGSCRP